MANVKRQLANTHTHTHTNRNMCGECMRVKRQLAHTHTHTHMCIGAGVAKVYVSKTQLAYTHTYTHSIRSKCMCDMRQLATCMYSQRKSERGEGERMR